MPKLKELAACESVDVHLTLSKNDYLVIQNFAKRNWMSTSSVIRIAISSWLSRKGLLRK